MKTNKSKVRTKKYARIRRRMNTTTCKKDRSVIKNRLKLPHVKSYYATKNEHVFSLVSSARKEETRYD